MSPHAVLAKGDIAVSQFEIPLPTITAFFRRARAAGATTILNPAPAIKFGPELLDLVDILILNETELGFLTGTELRDSDDPARFIEAARSLRTNRTRIICVTLGKRGVLALIDGEASAHRRPRRQGGRHHRRRRLLCRRAGGQLAGGQPIRDALDYANAAASICVQRMGAAPSMPTAAEVARHHPDPISTMRDQTTCWRRRFHNEQGKTMAKIVRVEILQVDLAPKAVRTDAIQSFATQETPMVRIHTSDGIVGTGYTYTIGTGGSSVDRPAAGSSGAAAARPRPARHRGDLEVACFSQPMRPRSAPSPASRWLRSIPRCGTSNAWPRAGRCGRKPAARRPRCRSIPPKAAGCMSNRRRWSMTRWR